MIDVSKRDIRRRDLRLVQEAWADIEQGINPGYQSSQAVADDDLALDLIYEPLREAWGSTTVQFSGFCGAPDRLAQNKYLSDFSGPPKTQHTFVESTLLASTGKLYESWLHSGTELDSPTRFGRRAPVADPVWTLEDESQPEAEPLGNSTAIVASEVAAASGHRLEKKKKTAGQLRWEEAVHDTRVFEQDVLRGAMQCSHEVASAVSQARKMVLDDEPPPLIAVRPEEELLKPGALSKACQANSEALALSIVRCPGFEEVNLIDRKGRTPLMWAAAKGWTSVCTELLKRSDLTLTTLNKRDRCDFWSALHHAAARGHDKVVLLFLDDSQFAVANKDDGRGRTALHLAARDGHAAVCRVLMVHPHYTKVNDLDPRGWSALHFAAMSDHLEVCKVLLYYRDFIVSKHKDIYGETALDYAEQSGFQKLCSYLHDHPRLQDGKEEPHEFKARAIRRHVEDEQEKQEGLQLPKRRIIKESQKGPKALRKLRMTQVFSDHLMEKESPSRWRLGPELSPQPDWYNRKEWSPRLARLGLSSRAEADEADPPPLVAKGPRLARRTALAFADDSDESTGDFQPKWTESL